MGTSWLSRRAIGIHLTALVTIPGFLALGWWQLHRALGGNTLSWAYSFEWPLFAAYGLYLWWRLIHEQPETLGESAPWQSAVEVEVESASETGTDREAVADGSTQAGAAAGGGSSESSGALGGDRDEPEDEELAAYNRYLQILAADDRSKRR